MDIDECEAGSIKYNVARIVRLTSGNYALFSPFVNGEGLPLVRIGPIEEIIPLIPSYQEISDYLEDHRDWASSKLVQVDDQRIESLKGKLMHLFKPKEPAVTTLRRI